MELRRLHLLDELARRGTVAAVAEALAYSPSSVSVQLAKLEAEAGVKLLRRVGRNVELTDAGRHLATYAHAALAADEQVLAELSAFGEEARGRVRMTFVQTTALSLAPGTLRTLAEIAPKVELEVIQRETEPALDGLLAREVDLVVGIQYNSVAIRRIAGIDHQPLLREEVLLLTPADDGSNAALPQPLEEVHGERAQARGERTATRSEHTASPGGHTSSRGEPATRPVWHQPLSEMSNLIWASGTPGSGLEQMLRNVCNRVGHFNPDIRHASDDGLVLGGLVATGQATTILPSLLSTMVSGVQISRLQEERLWRTHFTSTRLSAAAAPEIQATRLALAQTARSFVAQTDALELVEDQMDGSRDIPHPRVI